MGFLLRVRLPSFGAATASLAGFYLLSTDFLLAHDAVARQVASPFASERSGRRLAASTHVGWSTLVRDCKSALSGKLGATPHNANPRGSVNTRTRRMTQPPKVTKAVNRPRTTDFHP
ncbi:hypothetical protein BHM03_00013322 [Ensete ventricosum]|nr:hypothetical protein BHM03_00013322 [Ensete ventricosum]